MKPTIDPEEVRRVLDAGENLKWHTSENLKLLHAVAREWLRMQEQIVLDCGDSSCRFATTKGGMRTNGGCRCFERAGFGPSAVQAAYQMLPEIARLRAAMQEQPAPHEPWAEHEHPFRCTLCGVELDKHPRVAQPAPDVQAQIDAAVAKEREAWMQAVIALVGYETASAVQDDVIRARSGAKGGVGLEQCQVSEGECIEHDKSGVACEEGLVAARREGVIEGLEWVLTNLSDDFDSYCVDRIRAEIERRERDAVSPR